MKYALCVVGALIALAHVAIGYQILVRREYYLSRGYTPGRERYACRIGAAHLVAACLDLIGMAMLFVVGEVAFVIAIGVGAFVLWGIRKTNHRKKDS